MEGLPQDENWILNSLGSGYFSNRWRDYYRMRTGF